jgi:hypothetical protein
MIVKIQRALSPPDAAALAYSQDRKWQKFLPLTPALLQLFGDRVTIYADVEIVGQDMVIEKIVADRAW